MEPGARVEPQPMATTSLRLPVEVIDQLKQQAQARHLRYTSYVRSILERAARGEAPLEIADITERLERIERAVTSGQDADDQKTALCNSRQTGSSWFPASISGHDRRVWGKMMASPVTSNTCRAALAQTGDSAAHHQDQVITPIALSTMGANTIKDTTLWTAFQDRSATVWGRSTRMVNTTPA
jgi:CopG antitoxin of type II toxin-antitoxin system